MPAAPPRSRPAGAARNSPSRRPVPRRPGARTGDLARRMKIGRIVLVVALALSGLKLVAVQTVQSAELTANSAKQRTSKIVIAAERGSILDRAGNPLAFSTEARALVTNPRLINSVKREGAAAYKADMAAAVAERTGADRNALLASLNSDRGYVVLAPLADPDVARAIRERFPEIAEEKRESRQYPGGTLAANVIGAASWNSTDQKLSGLIGLESSQDNVLAGTDGMQIVDTAEGSSTVIPGSIRAERPATPGSDVQLTLDSDLQYSVQRQLGDYVTRTGAKGGSAVVLDAATGEVLALANGATFDPSNLAGADNKLLGNAAVSNPFEPGSVNKIVTMAAALEYGLANPEDVLAVPGSIKVADRTVNDAWKHGVENYTLTGVLAKSSNVGTIMMAQKVGEDRFADMLTRFGLGQRTGVGLPGESAGRVPARESWSGSTFGNLPIGQGLSMTVLQMAGMYQAVANDGVRIPPRIVSATIGPDGARTPSPAPEPVRVISPETAQKLRTMLTAVTQDARGQRGTGPAAAVPGYQVSGKTGTAQQVDPSCGCYAKSTYWITFAGMLPAQDPRYVIGIMLDAPQGGTSAAPLFHDIASYLAQREQIPVSTEPPLVQTLVAP
ncbi:peptidoglycan D,D-transpeptidase FtsI family protein [Pseudonocardia bannensis]|uniref:Penicillin-binding protein 2 n=1 Tax=Pseudonocardia bannensis TaxID=630973 RepID=A0A848DLX6_9PSEU|nr:penicillin-binding protein 2 [Pseudonocardia bannensis]NMH93384.1 penicillin-binding protein 2 [Pseudonocardia bannensis]